MDGDNGVIQDEDAAADDDGGGFAGAGLFFFVRLYNAGDSPDAQDDAQEGVVAVGHVCGGYAQQAARYEGEGVKQGAEIMWFSSNN